MKFIIFIFLIQTVLSSSRHDLKIESDEDCWTNEKNNTIRGVHGILVRFSPKVAYGQDACSVHISNPWMLNMQNGFGLFVSREMDCSTTLTVDCLPDGTLINRTKPSAIQFTCHTSQNKIEIPCSSIDLIFKRSLEIPEAKRPTFVQVVALAKEPCVDDDILFKCPEDYPDSCLDKQLKCNGRSECASGDDEYNCHPVPPSGVSIFVLILIILAFLFLLCILSIVCMCCCFRAAFRGFLRRFRDRKEKKANEKNNITATGEDAVLMKELNVATTNTEIPVQKNTEPTPLIIDSTKPMYPRLE